jgi:hypothetical protein
LTLSGARLQQVPVQKNYNPAPKTVEQVPAEK